MNSTIRSPGVVIAALASLSDPNTSGRPVLGSNRS
jgi:hypothetical protein